jgi:hypothetical protein
MDWLVHRFSFRGLIDAIFLPGLLAPIARCESAIGSHELFPPIENREALEIRPVHLTSHCHGGSKMA